MCAKRVCLLLLALCLAAGPLPVLAEADPVGATHLLYDVPYGTPWEEVTAAIEAQTGILPDPSSFGGSKDVLFYGGMQQRTLFGRPASFTGLFQDGGLQNWMVSFPEGRYTAVAPDEAALDAAVRKGISTFDEVSAGLQAQYGPPFFGLLEAKTDASAPMATVYDYPIVGGALDQETVRHAFLESTYASLFTRTGNIGLNLLLIRDGDYYTLELYADFSPDWASGVTSVPTGFQHESGGFQYTR